MKNQFENLNDRLNKNVKSEASFILNLALWKYFLIYIPSLFILFSCVHLLAYFFANVPFDWPFIAIQAIGFAIFLRIFHKLRFYWKQNWRKK